MKWKRLLSAFLLLLLLLPCVPKGSAQEIDYDLGFDLTLSANAIFFQNLDSGTIIYEKNADLQVHPASTTKIMTAALVMETCPDLTGTMVTVPDGVWNEFEGLDVSNAGLRAGEELSMLELLNCLMLQSANEAAVTIAAYYGRDTFIQMMNDKAKELGCVNTLFSNPHGAFVKDHHTTARDMAVITRWAIEVPGFWEISQKSRYDKRETNMNDAVTLVTTNEMQDKMSRYYTDYIKGIKTGTMEESGRCLVSTAQKDGMTYLLVILGAPLPNTANDIWDQGNTAYTDTRRCYDWAFEHLMLQNVVDVNTAVFEVNMKYAAGRDNLLVYPSGELYALLTRQGEDTRQLQYELLNMPESVKAPIQYGQVIGSARVYYGDKEIGVIDLVTHENIERSNFAMIMDLISEALKSTVAKVVYIIFLVFGIFYIYYVLVVVPRARRKQKQKMAQQKREKQLLDRDRNHEPYKKRSREHR